MTRSERELLLEMGRGLLAIQQHLKLASMSKRLEALISKVETDEEAAQRAFDKRVMDGTDSDFKTVRDL